MAYGVILLNDLFFFFQNLDVLKILLRLFLPEICFFSFLCSRWVNLMSCFIADFFLHWFSPSRRHPAVLGGAGSVVLVFCVMPKIEVGTMQVKGFFFTHLEERNIEKTAPLVFIDVDYAVILNEVFRGPGEYLSISIMSNISWNTLINPFKPSRLGKQFDCSQQCDDCMWGAMNGADRETNSQRFQGNPWVET